MTGHELYVLKKEDTTKICLFQKQQPSETYNKRCIV